MLNEDIAELTKVSEEAKLYREKAHQATLRRNQLLKKLRYEYRMEVKAIRAIEGIDMTRTQLYSIFYK